LSSQFIKIDGSLLNHSFLYYIYLSMKIFQVSHATLRRAENPVFTANRVSPIASAKVGLFSLRTKYYGEKNRKKRK
ncbi:MAG: hypothetical protein SPF56_05565, partial [Bacteroidaceae bacterium]|nr:hypothetical protein [Bacteroidaceae bacterium]